MYVCSANTIYQIVNIVEHNIHYLLYTKQQI